MVVVLLTQKLTPNLNVKSLLLLWSRTPHVDFTPACGIAMGLCLHATIGAKEKP